MYSSGHHATVHEIRDPRWFDVEKKHRAEWGRRADLVREESSVWMKQTEGMLLFYTHRIANLLFPKNTITVTGAAMHGCTTRLFSKIAPVPTEHATFSKDIPENCQLPKTSRCFCDDCKKHRHFHEENKLQEKAAMKAKEMHAWGLSPESGDCTDYCMTKDGDIVFFELGIKIERTESSLLDSGNSELQDRILPLVKRFKALLLEQEKAAFLMR